MPGADVVEKEMQYLYSDGEHWYFMETKTYEQHMADKLAVSDASQWLKEEDFCVVTLWNGTPLTVESANFVMLEVVETDPGLKGDTATGGSKPATLDSGLKVNVPLFIKEGDTVKVNTDTGVYMSRAE